MVVATALETPAPPVAPRARRRVRTVTAVIAALALVGAGTASAAWYHHLATGPVIGFAGYWANGSGVKINDDPFHGPWASVPYAPGGQVTIGMEIFDEDLKHGMVVSSVTFDGLARVDRESAFSSATVQVDPTGNSDPGPFRPFVLGGMGADVQWVLTMCPTGVAKGTGAEGHEDFTTEYTYRGLHRRETLKLPLPIMVEGVWSGCPR